MSERQQVRDEAVPALARGVRLRFDKARDVWVLLAPEKVLMPDQIAIEILKRCDGKATVARSSAIWRRPSPPIETRSRATSGRSYRTSPTRACSRCEAWTGALPSAWRTISPKATNSLRRGEVRRQARPTVRTGDGRVNGTT